MESARKIINTFLKTKYSPNELKGELFKVGEAAKEEGWTFMDASFQLGGKARDEGLSPDEVEQILRRAFSSEKRSSEREEAQPAAQAAPAAAAQAEPAAMAAPVKPAILRFFLKSGLIFVYLIGHIGRKSGGGQIGHIAEALNSHR
jgi:hypothetical protein